MPLQISLKWDKKLKEAIFSTILKGRTERKKAKTYSNPLIKKRRLADEIIAGELTRTEFNDMKIRDRIVQEAERDTFNAKKAAESSQELADLAKKK